MRLVPQSLALGVTEFAVGKCVVTPRLEPSRPLTTVEAGALCRVRAGPVLMGQAAEFRSDLPDDQRGPGVCYLPPL